MAPKSIERNVMRYSFDGFTYTCSGGCPFSSMARFTTFPPSIRL